MGTVMHLAPGETAPLYLELDTTGLKAGRYYTMLMLRPSMSGFRVCRVGFVVDVADADLSLANADKAGYDDAGVSFRPGRMPCPGLVAKLVGRGYNFLYITPEEANLYPRLGESSRRLPRMRYVLASHRIDERSVRHDGSGGARQI